jgi:hypothetical protein
VFEIMVVCERCCKEHGKRICRRFMRCVLTKVELKSKKLRVCVFV